MKQIVMYSKPQSIWAPNNPDWSYAHHVPVIPHGARLVAVPDWFRGFQWSTYTEAERRKLAKRVGDAWDDTKGSI